jgi:hypothetical protein
MGGDWSWSFLRKRWAGLDLQGRPGPGMAQATVLHVATPAVPGVARGLDIDIDEWGKTYVLPHARR